MCLTFSWELALRFCKERKRHENLSNSGWHVDCGGGLFTPNRTFAIPLFPRIAAVEFLEGTGSPSDSQCGGTGYDSPLTGPQPELYFQFVAAPCAVVPPAPPLTDAACIAEQKGKTECVDVCIKRAGVNLDCPGDAWCDPNNPNPPAAGKDYVYYSKSRNIGTLDSVVAKDDQLNMLLGTASMKLPFNMADANSLNLAGQAFVLRVNRRTRDDLLNENTNLPESGAAYVPQPLAVSPAGKFEIWSGLGVAPGGNLNVAPQDGAAPFINSDVCTKGTKEGFGPALNGRPVCATVDQANVYAKIFDALDLHHSSVIQSQILPQDRHIAWMNGGGAPCSPTRIMLASHRGAWGQAGAGRFYLNPDGFVVLNPVTDPFVANGNAFDIHRLGPHEYFHMLQGRWSQESPSAAPHIGLLAEEHADSVTYSTCMSLNAANPNECISGVKLHPQSGWGVRDLNTYETTPSLNAVYTDYSGGAFQVYAHEQFSYPVMANGPTSPHPGGTSSLRARPGVDASPIKTNDRNSDEGADLLGLLFRTFDQAQVGDTTTTLVDQCLQANLGRSFSSMVADFHTALFLKDYNSAEIPGDTSTAARWRFEWDGDGKSAIPSEEDKPYLPPAPNVLVKFGHLHATRVLDSYGCTVAGCPPQPCALIPCVPPSTCVPTCVPLPFPRVTLPFGGVISGVHAATSSFGAAAWSIQPEAGWIGSAVPFLASGNGVAPRFRAFAVQKSITPAGKTKLVPRPVCGSAPDYLCPISGAGGTGAWNLATAIPVDINTDEVLVIASAFDKPTQSNWAIGNGAPTLTLTSPTNSHQNFVGHPSTIVSPVFATAVYLGPDLAGLPVQPGSLVELEVVGCANAAGPGGCKRSGNDITVVPLSGGTFVVLAYLPPSFYPTIPALMATGGKVEWDLRVSVDGVVSNLQEKAVKVSLTAEERVSSLVIDNSASMAWGKLAGAKVAAKAIVGSLVPAVGSPPNRWLNIVTFSTDASTLPLSANPDDYGFIKVSKLTAALAGQLIDTVQIADATSIGDGMFEAQSNMACKFQPGIATAPPVIDSFDMHVLSDGVNSDPSTPEEYYISNVNGPTEDGNGAWCSTALTRATRISQNLQVPTISTIAFGQDADWAVLWDAARVTGGHYSYAPDGDATVTQAMAYLSQAMLMSQNIADNTQRLASATVSGGADQFFFVEPGATELRVVIAAEHIPLNQGGLANLFRVTDTGYEQVVPSETRNDGALVLKVVGPAPGPWLVRLDIPQSEVFFEAAVTSPTRFLTFAEAGTIVANDTEFPSVKHRGGTGTVELRTTVFTPTGPLPNCTVQSYLLSPLSQISVHDLLDDGKSSDGAAGDGVFGKTLKIPPFPGTYTAYFASACTDSSGETVWRQASRSFTISLGNDSDSDGMPDAWEITHALNPNDASDAAQDLDNDGLSNLGEFNAGTNPQLGDSDAGGESDGSEVAAGRNPLSNTDDRVKSAPFKVLFGNNSGAIFLGGAFDISDIALETWTLVQNLSAASSSVSRTQITAVGPGQYTFPTQSGVQTCLRLRIEKDGAYSPWSEELCGTPGPDTTAPQVRVQGEASRHGRWLKANVAVTDEIPHRARGELGTMLGLSPSGALQIRVGSSPSFTNEPWQTYSGAAVSVRTSRALRQASRVWVQARDGAGNLSEPQPVAVSSRASTLVDRAITLEEDAMEESTARVVKKRIRQSIPRLKLAAILARKQANGKVEKDRIDALVSEAVRFKSMALVQVARHDLSAAQVLLEAALGVEHQLALAIDQLGGSLELRDRTFAEDTEAE